MLRNASKSSSIIWLGRRKRRVALLTPHHALPLRLNSVAVMAVTLLVEVAAATEDNDVAVATTIVSSEVSVMEGNGSS